MENNIGVAVIIGLLITSSLYVWNSDLFSKNQKIFLLILILFPPAHWLAIIIVYLYEKLSFDQELQKQSKYSESKNSKSETLEQNLNSLKQTGIINDDEYKIKLQEIKNQQIEIEIANSSDYSQLKNLFESGILTKEEFDTKNLLLKSKFYESENVSKSIPDTKEVFEIGLWNKLTNYNKDLGRFMTIEIITENKQLNGYEINKKFDDNKYFLINEIEFGSYDKIEDLIFKKFKIYVKLFKSNSNKSLSTTLQSNKSLVKKSKNLFPKVIWISLIISVILFIVGYSINKNNEATFIDSYASDSSIDSLPSNTSYQNNYIQTTNQYDQINEYNRYVYVLTTIKIPKLNKSQIDGYYDLNIYHPTQYFYSIEWTEVTNSTEIVEIKNYSEDEKYKLLDKTDTDNMSKIYYTNMNFQAELTLKCNDYNKREQLANENKASIISTEIFDFSSYSLASIHKKNNTKY